MDEAHISGIKARQAALEGAAAACSPRTKIMTAACGAIYAADMAALIAEVERLQKFDVSP